MASAEQLYYGQFGDEHDAQLRACEETLPAWLDDSFPTHDALMVIWLDRQKGVDSPDNIVYLAPGLAMWLSVCAVIDDEDFRKIADGAYEEVDKLPPGALDVLTRGFKVKFSLPEGGEPEDEYPEWINGQARTFRMLTEEEEASKPHVFTATPDGTPLM